MVSVSRYNLMRRVPVLPCAPIRCAESRHLCTTLARRLPRSSLILHSSLILSLIYWFLLPNVAPVRIPARPSPAPGIPNPRNPLAQNCFSYPFLQSGSEWNWLVNRKVLTCRVYRICFHVNWFRPFLFSRRPRLLPISTVNCSPWAMASRRLRRYKNGTAYHNGDLPHDTHTSITRPRHDNSFEQQMAHRVTRPNVAPSLARASSHPRDASARVLHRWPRVTCRAASQPAHTTWHHGSPSPWKTKPSAEDPTRTVPALPTGPPTARLPYPRNASCGRARDAPHTMVPATPRSHPPPSPPTTRQQARWSQRPRRAPRTSTRTNPRATRHHEHARGRCTECAPRPQQIPPCARRGTRRHGPATCCHVTTIGRDPVDPTIGAHTVPPSAPRRTSPGARNRAPSWPAHRAWHARIHAAHCTTGLTTAMASMALLSDTSGLPCRREGVKAQGSRYNSEPVEGHGSRPRDPGTAAKLRKAM